MKIKEDGDMYGRVMAEASVTAHDTEMTGECLNTFKIGELLANRDNVTVISR